MNFVGDFPVDFLRVGGEKKTFLGYWSLYIHGKKHTV